MGLIAFCNRVIRYGFYLLFGLVPLLLTPWNYELFEYNKMMAVYALTVVIVTAWLVKMITKREIRVVRTPLDIPLLLFAGSQLISAIFSIDPHVSWWGYYSRFNGGLLSIASYVLLYFAFINNFTEQNVSRDIFKLLKIMLASATLVAAYGVAEWLGIDKHLWVQDVQTRVFSTLGQPNWLAAYLIALTPVAMGFAIMQMYANESMQIHANIRNDLRLFASISTLKFVLYSCISILFFAVLLFTRSRSGLFAFAVADIIFVGVFILCHARPDRASDPRLREDDKKNTSAIFAQKNFLLPLIFIHVAFAIVVFLNGTHVDSIDKYFTLSAWQTRFSHAKLTTNNPQPIASPSAVAATTTYTPPLLEVGGTESGTIRKYVWQAAINAWKSSTKTMLVGTGTETFAFAFYQFRPTGHNLTSEWDFLYNKAHNEYLNYLATTGILGLGSYLLFIGAFVLWFITRIFAKNSINSHNVDGEMNTWIVEIALFAGWASILITNFFGFSVVTSQLVLFLFPALIFATINTQSATHNISLPLSSRILSISVTFLGIFLLLTLGAFWYADTLFAAGNRANHGENYVFAHNSLAFALAINGNEPMYHDELANTYTGMTITALETKNATAASELAKRALTESDTALAISPQNVNFWKTRTKMFYSFSTFDPAFNAAAIEALVRAKDLSPNDPKIYYNLAILYGKSADNEKAIAALKDAIRMKPNYRDAYYALYVFYTDMKQTPAAQGIIEEYLRLVDPNDKEFNTLINAK